MRIQTSDPRTRQTESQGIGGARFERYTASVIHARRTDQPGGATSATFEETLGTYWARSAIYWLGKSAFPLVVTHLSMVGLTGLE